MQLSVVGLEAVTAANSRFEVTRPPWPLESTRELRREGGGVSPSRIRGVLVRPVRIHGIDIGEPVDAVFDAQFQVTLGLEVRCKDGVHRFLPWSAGAVGPEAIEVDFPLALLDPAQLEYYREHGTALSALRRAELDGGDQARVEDVVVDAAGRVCALVVENGLGASEVARARIELVSEGLRVLEDELESREPLRGAASY